MLDVDSSVACARAAARLFLRLSDYEDAAAEDGLCLEGLSAFTVDVSAAVGSDFAAIIPAIHNASQRKYVLKMQKVWTDDELKQACSREFDEWGESMSIQTTL